MLAGKEILAHAGIEQHGWTYPPFSRSQFANFTKERFIKEKFSLSFSLLYLVQSSFAKAKGLRAGINFSILNKDHK